MARSLNRQANFAYFSKLVGAMSKIRYSANQLMRRFDTVSDRFIAEIGAGGTQDEARLKLMISAMSFLRLEVSPKFR